MAEYRVTAIVLAAGQGRRMESTVQKQYMLVDGKPLIYYALHAFENSPVDRVILVVGAGEMEYCQKEILDRFEFKKVGKMVEGGAERYHSVYEGLKAAEDSDYVLIHDGARPLIDETIIRSAIEGAREYRACVIGMPVKDTIKISGDKDFACETPERSRLWMIQTPQAFEYPLIKDAYAALMQSPRKQSGVTDDAMVIELMTKIKVRLIKGSYSNIKVTTPEDIAVAEALLETRKFYELSQ